MRPHSYHNLGVHARGKNARRVVLTRAGRVCSVRICLVTPVPPRSRRGNRITALRWARLLRELGHVVTVAQEFRRHRCDVLIALHAVRSHPSIRRFANQRPGNPLVVALTGTDLYGNLSSNPEALESIELATRLVVLQKAGLESVPGQARGKTRVIVQSVRPPSRVAARRTDIFEVCVLGHLRDVKDPFRTAEAVRLLPSASRIRVAHIGAALTPEMEGRAIDETKINARYEWLGELPRYRALRVLSRCRLLSLTSVMEGGANAISESIVASVPVISSRIDGSIGLLGDDYPGYYPVGDTQALADLLERAETDSAFFTDLKSRCADLAPMFDPQRERRAWRDLLADIAQ